MACLKSGQVKEGAGLVRIDPISGPGICGAEYPLKVAMLGETSMLGFADDPRPPGAIPGAASQPRWPINQYPQSPPSYGSQPLREPMDARETYPSNGSGYGGPMSIRPPGIAAPNDSQSIAQGDSQQPNDEPQGNYDERSARSSDYQRSEQPYGGRALPPAGQNSSEQYPNASPLPRLGPAQGSPIASIGPVAMKPTATLACPLVSVLDKWIMESVQPAAMRWFGAPVTEIKQISAYSCRGMNGNSNAHISEHAFGNALDIAAFTLSDGRRISVQSGWKGTAEEQGFLRDVQGGACQQFTTVLAPGSNVYHYNHIHVDLMRRKSRRFICQPAAVSGAEVAGRVSQRGPYASRDPGVTGSLGGHRSPAAARPKSRDDDDWVEDESNIRER